MVGYDLDRRRSAVASIVNLRAVSVRNQSPINVDFDDFAWWKSINSDYAQQEDRTDYDPSSQPGGLEGETRNYEE